MTPDETYDSKSEGMVTHHEEPCGKGQVYKQFKSLRPVRWHFLEHKGRKHTSAKDEETVQPSASHRMTEARMATGVRSQSPAVQIASVGEASWSSSQRSIPIPATTLGTMIVEAFATPGNVSQEIMEFVLAFADLWTMTGTMDRTWGKVPETLMRVPPDLQPIMSWVRVGRSDHLSWDMLCQALGTSVFRDGCKTVEGMAQVANEPKPLRVGSLLGLFAKAFKMFIDQICAQDQQSSTGFVVAIVAAMNTHSLKSRSAMRILCLWSNLRVFSIKLEAQFSVPWAKYKRVTHSQTASGVLQGRAKRAMYVS